MLLRRAAAPLAAGRQHARPAFARTCSTARIPDNTEVSTGMEKKEEMQTPDIFWSREPIVGHFGTKENPAIVPSFNESRVVGLETEQGASLQSTRCSQCGALRSSPLHTTGARVGAVRI